MGSDFSVEDKAKVEDSVVQIIINGLDKGLLAEKDLSEISNFVLKGVDSVKTREELILFSRNLSAKWPIFKNLETILEGATEDVKEDNAASQILKMAKNGNIDAAIDLAKNTMEETHATTNL